MRYNILNNIICGMSIALINTGHYLKRYTDKTGHERINKVEYKDKYKKVSIISPSKLNDKRNFVKNLTE